MSVTPLNVERNVIYGMYSGFALLMDVHRPVKSNGYGIVFVAGSGWQAPLDYGATPLKETQVPLWGPALVAAGYTVFAVNHRAAPRFHYPAAVEDVQRAVRFIRHHAKVYGIDPDRLGGLGGSSGGHLVGLVSTLGAPGIAGDPDPVNREPATLQTVVLRAPLVDLPKMTAVPAGLALVVSFLEVPLGDNVPTSKALWAAGLAADARVGEDAADAADARRRRRPGAVLAVGRLRSGAEGRRRADEADHGAGRQARRRLRLRRSRKPGWLNYYDEAAKWFDQVLEGARPRPRRAAS